VPGNPTFAISISGPGQGFDCPNIDFEKGNPKECVAASYGGFEESQKSVGDDMSSLDNYLEGFNGSRDVSPPPPNEPDHSYGWDMGMSVLRAVKLFKMGLDTEGWTNGWLVLGGYSFGGIMTLIINGVDDRIDGAFTMFACGGFKEILQVPGNNQAYRISGGVLDASYSCDDPLGSESDIAKMCDMWEFFEPTVMPPKHDFLMVVGAEDESFSFAGFDKSVKTYSTNLPEGIHMYGY